VFGTLVLLAAWFGGERLILRPIRSLVRTATRFGRGDLQARAAHEPWMAEFAPLAAAFDDMARKLAAREDELRIANEHLEVWRASTALPALPIGADSIASWIRRGAAPTNCASRSL
jgi:nitrogen fixation/metabolism regulation signal transduction histidine kinase